MFSGDMHQTRAEFTVYSAAGRSQFRLEHERNNRNDTPQRSYSPVRKTLRAAHEIGLLPRLRLAGAVSRRTSDYPNVGTNQEGHQDTRSSIGFELRWQHRKNLALSTVYDYIYNHSVAGLPNVAANYRYQRYTLGVMALYSF
ncbi:MAG: hypothetical protein AABY83_00110, partial [Pseudomonadota bacterium]